MSQLYRMSVEITGYNPQRTAEIQAAANAEWDWEDSWCENPATDGSLHIIIADSADQLAGGESEEEFARRLQLAIWKANQAYCRVYVAATCLEDLPYESYESDVEEYEKAKAAGLLTAKE